MKKMKKNIFTGFAMSLLMITGLTNANAQTDTVKVKSANLSFDLVSSYIWRGVQQGTNEPNFQPSLSYGNKFKVGVWGSTNISSSMKEVDLYATYTFNDLFSATLTDYNYNFKKSYFEYENKTTDHVFEGTVVYAGVKKFPLSVSANVMFYGADKKPTDATKNAYSTYIELGYPIVSNVSLFAGLSLFESSTYVTSKNFQFINVGAKATKELKFNDKYSLPVYVVLGVNPHAETAFLVAGITL